MYKKLHVRLESVAPLLMHNGQLADPSHPISKEKKKITDKKKKTDEDKEEVSRLDFVGGLYVNDKGHPCLPAELLEAVIREGAKVSKNGQKINAGVFVEEDTAILLYDGPRTAEGLYADQSFVHRATVRQQQSRIVRVRPRFNQWAVEFTVNYLPAVIDKSEVIKAIEDGGSYKGLGDYRPRYGRFTAVVTEVPEPKKEKKNADSLCSA